MGVLPLLLPLRLLVCLHGSLPSVMEPGSRGVTGVWSDCLLRRHECSWYACNRVATAPTRPPSHRLQQVEATASWGSGIWRSPSPTKSPWDQEVHWTQGHSEEDHGSAPPRQTGSVNARATHNDALHTPDNACLTATPGAAHYALPTSSATAKKAHGEGSCC